MADSQVFHETNDSGTREVTMVRVLTRYKVAWKERHVAVVLANDKDEAFEKAVNMHEETYVETEDEHTEIDVYDYSKGEENYDKKFFVWEEEEEWT